MSESTRALCQIIEARPLLTLTGDELELLTYLTERHAIVMNDPVSTALFNRLRDEGASRHAFEHGRRNANDQADAALAYIQSGTALSPRRLGLSPEEQIEGEQS